MGELRGRWHGAPFHDFRNRKWLLTFEVDQEPRIFEKTQDAELIIAVDKYRPHRSKQANRYFHKITGMIAEQLGISKTEAKNIMLARYGQEDDEIKNIIMNDAIPWEKLDTIHLRPTAATRMMDNGEIYRVYIVIRGSSTYNTQEMARLIDGTVSEAKELGIETLPPEEIERMKQAWRGK